VPTTTGTEPYEGDNWGAAALARSIDRYGPRAKVTAGMTCVARQLGEFKDLYGSLPTFGLQEFVLARYGSMVSKGPSTFAASSSIRGSARHRRQ